MVRKVNKKGVQNLPKPKSKDNLAKARSKLAEYIMKGKSLNEVSDAEEEPEQEEKVEETESESEPEVEQTPEPEPEPEPEEEESEESEESESEEELPPPPVIVKEKKPSQSKLEREQLRNELAEMKELLRIQSLPVVKRNDDKRREMEEKVKDEKRYPPRKGVVNVPMNRKPDKTNKTTLSMKGRGMNSMPSQQVSMLTFDSLLPGVDTSFGGYPYKINLI